tara:strand:- start:2697 stop:5000 length:2304 start_codon:yes stop_codon:yes gene_type:complete
MNKQDINGYDFSNDRITPTMVMDQLRAHDARMHNEQPYMALAKAAYTTKFWRYIEGQEDLNVAYEMSRLDQVEVNRLKPALTGYLANLYPRKMKVVVGPSSYTTGDIKKAEMLVNHWLNRPIMRERILNVSRQALLYKGAGAKIGYDPAEEGINRVWMRVFPYWEMVLDHDVHDRDDARFIGHVSYRPRKEVMEEYGLSEDIAGTSRNDYLGAYLSGTKRVEYKGDTAQSDATAFVRVLELCNKIDDFYDTDGSKYKGRLEIYVLDDGYDGEVKPVYMGPLPLVEASGKAMPHIVPLIFEHEPEYPYRGIAYSEQLLPQQKEINTMRSYMAQSARRDARVYLAPKGALDADAYSDLKSGEDGLIIEVDEQYAGNLANVVVPIRHGPISANIQVAAAQAEADFERNMVISPAALGQVTKATASEIAAVEGHTQSEFGRHAEMRDMFLIEVVKRCFAAHVASLYDPGDSEGAEANIDEEGMELDQDDLEVRRDAQGIEEADDFKPHMMYDPKTGESERADTHERHVELGNQGWSHDKPGIKEVEDEFEQTEDEDKQIIDLASEVEPERREDEISRTEQRLMLLGPEGEAVEVLPEDIDSDFEIGFTEAGRSPMAQSEMRNNILALSDKMLQLLQVSQEQKNAMGVMAGEILKTIHDQFDFPQNLSLDYILAETARIEEESPPEEPPPEAQAPPEGQPEAPPEAPPEGQGPEEILAQIESLPPDQALLALEQLLAENPQAMEAIQKAKTLPPEQQAEAVKALIQAIRESV